MKSVHGVIERISLQVWIGLSSAPIDHCFVYVIAHFCWFWMQIVSRLDSVILIIFL